MNFIAKEIQALRVFSGEGIQTCKVALIKADGDVKLAYGFLKAQGCAIHTENRLAWEENYAKSWLKDLTYENGVLDWAEE